MKHRNLIVTAFVFATIVLGGAPASAQGNKPVTVGVLAPLTVGVLAPLDGHLAELGADTVRGLELAFAQAAHTAGGREIVMVVKDTEGRPDVGRARAAELIAQNVDFVAGVVDSGVAYAVYDEIVASGVPMVVTGSTADGLTKQLARPNVFRTINAASQSGHVLGHWLARNGYRRLALVGADVAMGYEEMGGVARTFTIGGGKVVASEYVPIGADFGPVLERVAAAGPDVVASALAGEEARRFLMAYAASSLAGAVQMADTGITTDCGILYSLADPSIAEGTVSATDYSMCLESEANLRFRSAYTTRFGAVPSLFAESAFVAGRLIVKTLEALDGDLSSSRAVLETMSGMTIDAPRGPFRFDAYNNPVHTIYMTRVEFESLLRMAPVFDSYPAVSQFWRWTPEEFMAMADYADLAQMWAPDPSADVARIPVPAPVASTRHRLPRERASEPQVSDEPQGAIPGGP